MKKEMTLGYGRVENTDERAIVEMIVSALRIPREWLRKYYSAIMGREVNSRQSGLITRTQLSLVAVILLAPHSLLLGLVSIACLAASLFQCKKEL